jgi:peptidoglycan/xylan/chitin deacetylase (PgdA/CDA1 family)
MDATLRSHAGVAAARASRSDRTGTRPPAYVTTSWDDGHPLDLRAAELLAKHGIRGTFYVPETAEHERMTLRDIRALSADFEVGAHTIRHADLTRVTDDVAWQEISRSKAWIEDVTGRPCVLFCPPLGRYAARHLDMIRRAGYVGLRSVEVISLDFPRRHAGLLLMPTSLQAHPQGFLSVARNALKRAALGNLWRFIVHGGTTEWPRIAQSLLCDALVHGGVFHLWGHSWELEENGQWLRLEEVLRLMGAIAAQAPSLTNGEVCRRVLTGEITAPARAHARNWAGHAGGAAPS